MQQQYKKKKSPYGKYQQNVVSKEFMTVWMMIQAREMSVSTCIYQLSWHITPEDLNFHQPIAPCC